MKNNALCAIWRGVKISTVNQRDAWYQNLSEIPRSSFLCSDFYLKCPKSLAAAAPSAPPLGYLKSLSHTR